MSAEITACIASLLSTCRHFAGIQSAERKERNSLLVLAKKSAADTSCLIQYLWRSAGPTLYQPSYIPAFFLLFVRKLGPHYPAGYLQLLPRLFVGLF